MIDFNHYIKAKSVVDTYLNHINNLNGTFKKQHFLTRLGRCEGYGHILEDNRTKVGLFAIIQKDLEKKLKMSFDEIWDELMDGDNFGYKKEIKKIDNDDIKFYFGMTDILEKVCILLRHKMDLPKGIEKMINRGNFLKMIDIANDDTIMKEDESTTYVNGIGEIICLKQLRNDLVPVKWDTINECYKKIWQYYIEKCGKSQEWLSSKFKTHNNIYGLTHCVINLTNYYTVFIQNNEEFLDQLTQTANVLINLVDSQKQSNYRIFDDDTLAEMLLCIKLCGQESCIERINALNTLSLRFDSNKLMFRRHKATTFKEELIMNEHTNILYILNVLF